MYLGRQSTPLDCMYNNLKIYGFCLSMYINASSAFLGQRDALTSSISQYLVTTIITEEYVQYIYVTIEQVM